MERIHLMPAPEDNGRRLDQYLAEKLPQYSRNHFQKFIRNGLVTVDAGPAKANHRIRAGERIVVVLSPPKEIRVVPENIDLNIVYEDGDIAVINKPQGMVVHPAPGHESGTLVNALLYHYDELSDLNGKFRPGIVHRIDKDTSGLLVIAKNNFAHSRLAEQLQKKEVSRQYLALAEDNIKQDSGTICAPMGRNPANRKKMAVVASGRNAVTHFRVLERFGFCTYLECKLETGRTHQIRVHLSHIGHPIMGDPLYGRHHQKFSLDGQALHAARLSLIHPRTGKYMEFSAPLPDYFEKLLKILRQQSKKF